MPVLYIFSLLDKPDTYRITIPDAIVSFDCTDNDEHKVQYPYGPGKKNADDNNHKDKRNYKSDYYRNLPIQSFFALIIDL